VEELPVEEGDAVQKSQPLARLRTRTIEAEVAAARAELDLRKQELAELENGSRPEEIAAAKAAMLAAKARREYAQKDWARIQRLFEESSAASDEFDEALSRADETEQEFLKDQAAYEMALVGPRKERIEQIRARMEQQRHEVERLEDILSKYTVVAPFDGYVTSKQTEVGAWLTEGAVVAEVVELAQVDVEALVPEDHVHRLQIGMPGTVRVPSLSNEEFIGTVAAIVPQADMRSRSFPVKVRVDNPVAGGSPKLKSGMFAEVKLAIGEPKLVLLVSKDAIVLGGPSPIVYVFEPSEKDPLAGAVRDVPVKLGLSVEALIEVRGELRPGQQVVTVGNERLSPGRPVRIAETGSARTAAGGETAEVTRPTGP
jgi:RND family efflux transporter MFP subunit